MSEHYAFSGKANRVSAFAFFEKHNLSLELQGAYYRWWYEWAKQYVMDDPDLRVAKAYLFAHYPLGQHAHANFHLHDYTWATQMVELGEFVTGVIFPKLDASARQRLEQAHRQLLERLLAARADKPRPTPPDIGRYRHT